jgi:hypothetical protein
MIINMTTISKRKVHYIDQTLESLFCSDGRDLPVNLIVGSFDSSHVEQYENVATIVRWDQAAQWSSREGNPRHNCNLNAIRALKHGDDDYCVTCEDDIVFAKDWYHALLGTIAEIESRDFVLNLGQKSDQTWRKRYAVHTQLYLCGAQAIFYPNKVLRSRIATYLEENMRAGMNDHLVGQYAKRFAALYNTTPPLVGHIGKVSSFDAQS